MLDTVFGNKGKIVIPLAGFNGISAIALKKDGKILSLGDAGGYNASYVLACHESTGELDKSFGENGIVQETDKSPYRLDMALQSDEKILVCGFDIKYSDPGLKLIRYDSDGSLDSSFGINGIVMETFYGYEGYRFSKVVVKPDGKILALGELFTDDGKYYLGLAQFNEDGSVDELFGTEGKLVIGVNGFLSHEFSLKFYNEKILIAFASYYESTSHNEVSIYSLNDDGSNDWSFGSLGVAIQTIPGSNTIAGVDMAIQPDGKIVIFADGQTNYTTNFGNVIRFLPNGAPDYDFANNGLLLIPYNTNNKISICYKVNIQQDGKILITGTSFDIKSNNDFLILRYSSTGRPDSTFGRKGFVVTDFRDPPDNRGYTSIIQPDGKLVVGGLGYNLASSTSSSALARYELNSLAPFNTIKGYAYIDKNKDNVKDASEVLASNVNIVSIKPDADTISVHVSNGNFSIDIDTGTYATKVNPRLPYYTTIPAVHTTSNTTYFNTDSVSFALQPISGNKDLAVSLVPVNAARPGFDVRYKILCTNQGTDTASSPVVSFINNSKLNFISAAPAVTSVRGDTLRWTFSDLKPMDTASITLNLRVQAPPSVNNGDTLRSVATILSSKADLTPDDNTSVLVQRVVGSYDPNDKTENHGGRLKVSQVQKGDELVYTIRFQNTGTDTAFNVFIRDTLSNKVDWSTLKMITSSHNFQLTINDGNKCAWALNNINLVDSSTNEKLSHGYIVYSVKAKKAVVAGETINNTAHIYFDYNLPVQTNTERTTVESTTLPVKLITFTAKRLGKNNEIQWLTDREVNIDKFDIERSPNGTVFTKIGTVKAGLNQYTFSDYTPAKTINYYRLKMIDKDGKYEYSPVRTVDNTGSFYVSSYPNPATEQLIVQVESEKQTSMQLQIVSMDGKIMLSKQSTVAAGLHLQSIDVSNLQSGTYFLQIITSEKNQTMVKFQKL